MQLELEARCHEKEYRCPVRQLKLNTCPLGPSFNSIFPPHFEGLSCITRIKERRKKKKIHFCRLDSLTFTDACILFLFLSFFGGRGKGWFWFSLRSLGCAMDCTLREIPAYHENTASVSYQESICHLKPHVGRAA